MVKSVLKKVLKILNAFIKIAGYKLFLFRKNKVHNPVIFDLYSWESYYENLDEMKLYKKGMEASFSSIYDNPYKQLRFYSLQSIFENILKNKIKGDVAECGVWKGHSAYILLSMIDKYNFNKSFHIFDSFEGGLSDKTAEDKNRRYNLNKKQINREKLSFASNVEQVESTLSSFKNISIYKGWIPKKFKEVKDKTFCFVHIDVDLYQPTFDSLNFFFPRLTDGGAIVIDDYGSSQFPGARKAVEKFLKSNNTSFFYKVPFGSCFIIK